MSSVAERCTIAPGLEVSRVLTGLWQVADMERDGNTMDAQAAAAALVPYVHAGLTAFDMADHYGSAELIAGALRSRIGSPGGVQLLTKWVPQPGPVTRDDVRSAVQRALTRLDVERIDLLQFHAWSYDDPSYLDCLFSLQELKREGLIQHIGLTNFDVAHLRIVVRSGIEIVSNQVSFSVIDGRPRVGMTRFCSENGISLLAYGTVAGGFLTDRFLDAPDPAGNPSASWSQMKYRRFIEAAGGWGAFQTLLHALDAVARRLGVSIANVATRFILDQPAVAGIIIGARPGQNDHIRDNLRLFEFRIDETSRSEIEQSLSKLQPIPGDCGDEYRRPPFLTASGDLSHHVASLPAPYDVRTTADGRTRVVTGTDWEAIAGYSRAIRIGSRILVSGTTAVHVDRTIGGDDASAQLHFIIDKVAGVLRSLGGRFDEIVRTRVYLRNIEDWEAVARAHGERFRDVLPVNTLIQAAPVGDDYLVEMETEAVVSV